MFYWLHIAFIGVISFCAFSSHFILTLTGVVRRKNRRVYPLYLPSALLLFLHFFRSPVLYSGVAEIDGSLRFVQTMPSLPSHLYSVYVPVVFLFNIVLLLLWMKRTELRRIHRQGRILTVTLLGSIVMGVFSDMYLPRLVEGYHSNGLGIVCFLLWMAGIFYAVVRYDLLSITPERISHEIVSNIEDYLFLIDKDEVLVAASRKTAEFTGMGRRRKEIRLKDVVVGYEELVPRIKSVFEEKEEKSGYRFRLKNKRGELLSLYAQFRLVRDNFGDGIGVLFHGRETQDIGYLTARYGITARETDILQAIVNGYTNREIAELLGITERTVKYHVNGIYNRLGIDNRAQLFHLLSESK